MRDEYLDPQTRRYRIRTALQFAEADLLVTQVSKVQAMLRWVTNELIRKSALHGVETPEATLTAATEKAEELYPTNHTVDDPGGETGEAESDPYGYDETARKAFILGATFEAARRLEAQHEIEITDRDHHTYTDFPLSEDSAHLPHFQVMSTPETKYNSVWIGASARALITRSQARRVRDALTLFLEQE